MMNPPSLDVGRIHIIGIGGIGMSGIADVLNFHGYKVQGSDLKHNANTQRLQEKGIAVFEGHRAENIKDVSVVVCSSAVKANNPEIKEAQAQGIPVINRAEMLSELMRFYYTVAVSGTHGKTTTTSLVGQILKGLSPTIINGGIINKAGSNVEIGTGKWMVVEADESDGTFVRVPATIAVITNIDPEHLDFYGSFEALKENFKSFAERVAFYGFAVLCYDHPVVRDLAETIQDARVYTYGLEKGADLRAVNLREEEKGIWFDLEPKEGFCDAKVSELKDFFIPLHGAHNVLNALAALVVGLKMTISPLEIKQALLEHQGVRRRFTEVGMVRGMKVVDDYAHHPVEIRAVVSAARPITKGRLRAVFQPHRYSRLTSLFDDFIGSLEAVDQLYITPVYAAGEEPILDVNEHTFSEKYQAKTGKECVVVENLETLLPLLESSAEEGDRVLFLGAGDITKWAYQAVADLQKEEN